MALQQLLAMKKGTILSYNKQVVGDIVEKLWVQRSITNPVALLSEMR